MLPLFSFLVGTFSIPHALAQSGGLSIATLSVPEDAISENQAMVIGQLVRQGFARNPRYSLLDLEGLLDDDASAVARQNLRRATDNLSRARVAYESFELDAALEILAEAIVAFEQSVAVIDDYEPYLEALKMQAATYELAGESRNARRVFERLLTLEPDTLVSDLIGAESVEGTFVKAQKRHARKKPGILTVYATPAAAEVWVDGRFRGSAPLSIDFLPAGRHFVRVYREGYQSYGTTIEVPSDGEETLQVSMRPAARFAEFDALVERLGRDDADAAREMTSFLRVEQLFWVRVSTAGDDVTLTGTLFNGISGTPIATGNKTFVFNSPRFRGDVELWVAQNFRRQQRSPQSRSTENEIAAEQGGDFLPDRPLEKPESPKVEVGWWFIRGSSVPFVVGVASGIYSLYWYDVYKNGGQIFGQSPLPHQLHPQVPTAQTGYFASSLVADIGYALGAVSLLTGAVLVAIGTNEELAVEDVLAQRQSPAPLPSIGSLTFRDETHAPAAVPDARELQVKLP